MKRTEINFAQHWWRRRAGGREALRLAGPIIVSCASFALMNFADRVYLTWYDQRAMSAAFQSGCLLWALMNFPVGIATFTNAFVSQYNGACQYKRIGEVVWQGVYFGLVSGLLFLAATPLIVSLFRMIMGDSDLLIPARDYWFYLSLGASPAIAHEPLTAYFCGRRDMKTVMRIGLASVLFNAALDPILIFGVNGHFRWGVVGAAVASALSLWLRFFVYLYLALRRDKLWRCGLLDRWRFNGAELSRLLKYGAMSALQHTVDSGFFELFILLMAWFGEVASAAAAIAFNLDFLAFMPIVGLGIATTANVGNYVGAKRYDLARRATITTLQMTVLSLGALAALFAGAPNFFLDFYALNNPKDFELIRPAAVSALRFVSLYLLADGVNIVMASALRGAGDARYIMLATLAVATPCLCALFIGVFTFGMGVTWSWSWTFIYILLLASSFTLRFCQGGWREKRLVEDDLLAS